MEAYAGEWLQFLIRWVHVITGIAWIGASFYFIWLDNHLLPPRDARDAPDAIGGELSAIHGGGFYHVEKFRVAPTALPSPLHWFKWEAYSTWLSGFALLVVLYWWHAGTYMIDRSVAAIAPWHAVVLSAALLVGGWVFYDQLCKRLGFARERVLGIALVVFFALVAWGLSKVLSGRAMYLQVGAMLGTIMAANVLFVIIPGQRQLVVAKEQGRAPDPVYGLRGKQRSVHNNYFTLPVLLTMISNHYPMTYGHPRAWLVLVALLLLAAYVRHFFNLRHGGRTVWAIPVTAAIATLALAVAIAPGWQGGGGNVSIRDVQAIVEARCVACHADRPRQEGIAVAPKGVVLETPAQIAQHAAAIRQQAVASRAMPLGNLTNMTDEERARLGAWIDAGARVEP
ncbi:MAG TPA: urate hydroxylase PuuD [Casimicrobiaceae bacterium]|nr:urate hydroxylase PuuD [Casimicrobiaceae bacterium]